MKMGSRIYKYHVTFGESKKVIQVTDNEQIFMKIVEAFKIDQTMFMLQYFDKEFSDWVDVDNIEDIPKSCKILVKNISPENSEYLKQTVKLPGEKATTSAHLADLVFLPLPKSKPMEELITETVHDADLLHPSSDPTEAHNRKVSFHTPSDSVCPPTDTTTKVYNVIQEHSAHNTERHNQLRPIANGHWEKKTHEVALQTDLTSTQERTNSKTEPSWVDSYTLPDFSPTLRQRITSLKKRDILEACYRSEIINCLFHSVFELQSHPKQLECTTICDMLIIKYPALQDKDPCFWQKLLSQKFKDYHHVTDFVKANFGGFPKRSRQGDGDNNEFPKSKVTRCEQVGKKKSSKNVPSVQSRADVPMPTHSRSTKSSLSTSSDDDSMTSSFEVTNVSESDKSPPLNESCSTVNSLVPWATNVGVRRGMPLPKFSEKVESALKVGSAGFVMNRVIQECALHVLKHGDMVKKRRLRPLL